MQRLQSSGSNWTPLINYSASLRPRICESIFLPGDLIIRVAQSVMSVCSPLTQLFGMLFHLNSSCIWFDSQGHRLEFMIAGENCCSTGQCDLEWGLPNSTSALNGTCTSLSDHYITETISVYSTPRDFFHTFWILDLSLCKYFIHFIAISLCNRASAVELLSVLLNVFDRVVVVIIILY